MIRFAIIGAGWRARYFMRVERDHKDELEIVGVLVRSEEKALAVSTEFNIPVTLKEEDIENAKPDFIVVCVSKSAGFDVAMYWKNKGYRVMLETPAGKSIDELKRAYEGIGGPGKLFLAEQYRYYPTYRKIIETVKSGKIGTPVAVNISLAHEYHGASLIREILGEAYDAPFRIRTSKYDFPVSKTGDRFDFFYDGEIITKTRVVSTIEFEDGKVAFYDFDSDQYHSLIRRNTVRITGTRGEIIDGVVHYLDENNRPVKETLTDDFQFAREEKTEDEFAVYTLLKLCGGMEKDEENREFEENNLNKAMMDAYIMILMAKNSDWVCVNKLPWME